MHKLFNLLLLLGVSAIVRSQSVQSVIPSLPTSPQADAIKVHGDINVNPSSGTPDISIPLYEIEHYGYRLPMALKYVAQPIKPGYNFDVFGVGWSLSISSCVSRSVAYVPDEWRNFKLEVPGGTPGLEYFNICGTSCLTNYNYAHDKFNVVLPNGSSCNFIIDNQNENISIKVSDGRKVKITYSIYNTEIQWFAVVDENGVKYTFGVPEYPRSGGYMPYPNTFVSWLLTRIDLPYTPEPILFDYENLLTPFATSCGEPSLQIKHYRRSIEVNGVTYYYNDFSNFQRTTSYTPSAYNMRLLNRISFGKSGNSQVRFFYQQGSVWAQTYQANKMEVREGNKLIRELGFETQIRDGSTPCYSFPVAQLKNVTIKGSQPNDVPLKYEFSNYSISTFSGFDHWGNLNTNGTDLPNYNLYYGWDLNDISTPVVGTGTMIHQNPQMVNNWLWSVNKETYDPSPFYKYKISLPSYSGSDCKRADAPAIHGVLNKITYPTGGFTDFEYENHEFLTSTDGNGNYVHPGSGYVRPSVNASAFRIKTITSYQRDGIVSSKKNYRYGATLGEPNNPFGHSGYGEAVVSPNIATYLEHSRHSEFNIPAGMFNFSLKNMLLGLDQNGQLQPFTNPFNTEARYFSRWSLVGTVSSANFRKLLGGRQPVVYSEVSVYDGVIDENNKIYPKGKTVFKYDLHGLYPGEDIYEPLKNYGNNLGYEPTPHLYNRLIDKTDYRFDAQLQQFLPVRQEASTYNSFAEAYLDYEYGNDYIAEAFQQNPPGGYGAGNWLINPAFTGKPSYLGISLPVSKTVTETAADGNTIVSSEYYGYNPNHQLSSTSVTGSRNEGVIRAFTYPSTGMGTVIDEMLVKNIISPVVEATTSVSYLAPPSITAGQKVEYGKFGTAQIILPAKSYRLETKPSGNQYVLEGEIKSYSANGRPLEALSKGSSYTAYQWGYDDRYMVAEAKNAQASQIAYSSFEDAAVGTDATKNWAGAGTLTTPAITTPPPTGRQYYNLTNVAPLSRTVTVGKIYIISYWRNSGSAYSITGATSTPLASSTSPIVGATVNGWTYFEHRVTATSATISVAGVGGIDEVRLYPADAQMTTYTYDPLVGMTSQSDTNGNITYQEYDSFGRLQYIRDENRNILKAFDYKYQITQ